MSDWAVLGMLVSTGAVAWACGFIVGKAAR